jgi:hypothetical protein
MSCAYYVLNHKHAIDGCLCSPQERFSLHLTLLLGSYIHEVDASYFNLVQTTYIFFIPLTAAVVHVMYCDILCLASLNLQSLII